MKKALEIANQQKRSEAAKPKVLVVGFNNEDLVPIKIALSDLSTDVVYTTNTDGAIKANSIYEFSLAILDLRNSKTSGYKLAGLLRDKKRKLPVLFIGPVGENGFELFNGYEEGLFSFIVNPLNHEKIVSEANKFIRKYQKYKKGERGNTPTSIINKEIDAFSYSVSHDLKSPLIRIYSYVNVLQETYAKRLDEDGKKIILSIQQNINRMNELIENLYTFSKLGNKTINYTDIHMNSLVNSVSDELINFSAGKNSLPKMIIKRLPPAIGDHVLIRQVLVNLISNAIKFSLKGVKNTIEIGAYQKEDMNVYYVKDNGVGFDMKYADKLFKVFQRLHSESDYEGTGAGLAIVQRIIRKHGGEVWAESCINEGSTFYFSLNGIQ